MADKINKGREENYLEEAFIENPLNIKRVNGDLPTKKGSPKNIMTLIVVGAILALTLNTVWKVANSIIGYPSFTLLFMVVVYSIIGFVTMHYTVLEGPKNVRAYADFLDNKVKDLSIMWEIQDIRELDILGRKIGYIDYIDSSRAVILKCVPGPIMNTEPDKALLHYNSLEKAVNLIDELGYAWEISVAEEPSDETLPLTYFYNSLKNYSDPEFVSTFTDLLDTIDYIVQMYSAINSIYLKIYGVGSLKHNMSRNLTPLTEILMRNTCFTSVEFLTASEIDKWNAADNSVNSYDREELIMNKYKGSVNLGLTFVTVARDESGNIIKRFQDSFDTKRLVKKKSIALKQYRLTSKYSGKKVSTQSIYKKKISLPAKNPKSVQDIELIPRTLPTEDNVTDFDISDIQKKRDRKLLELIYSEDKVRLGD